MRLTLRATVGLLVAVLLVGSCTDGDSPVQPLGGAGSVFLPLELSMAASPAAVATSRPINRIRAVARSLPDRTVVGTEVLDVDPNASAWDVSIEVTVNGASTRIEVTLELIHVDPSGVETVEFSARTEPFELRAGEENSPAEVELIRGPLDNLSVTGLEILGAPPVLREGQSAQLSAEVRTDGSGEAPQVFWSALDPNVVGLEGTTATALLPGEGRITAAAGAFVETVTIRVLPRVASVSIEPTRAEVEGTGVEVRFQGSVLDPRGDAIPNEELTWGSLSPDVVESVGEGVFRTVGLGVGRVEARSVTDASIVGEAEVEVLPGGVDVAVEKSVDRATASEGDDVRFTVTASNPGDALAEGVVVEDLLPDGLEFVSAGATVGTYSPDSGVWEVGPLPPGDVAVLTLSARVAEGTSGQTLTNTAEIRPGDGIDDLDPSNDRASASVVVEAVLSDLRVAKVADRTTVDEGEGLTYSIVVENLGPGDASAVEVQESLPPGVTLLRGTTDTGAFDGQQGLWTLALGAGESATLTVDVETNVTGQSATRVNRVSVRHAGNAVDPVADNDVSEAIVEVFPVSVPRPDVRLVKTVDVPTPAEGDPIVFTITVDNIGSDDATNVLVDDVLPTGLTFVGDFVPTGVVSLGNGSFSIPSLATSDSYTFEVDATVDAATGGQTLVNTVRVTSLDQTDSNTGNDQATASVTVQSGPPDIAITKTASQTIVAEANTITFSVTAENVGSGDASNVVVQDVLDAAFQFVSATASSGSYNAATGDWTVPSIAAGTTETLDIVVTIASGTAGTTPNNSASLTGSTPVDSNTSNDVDGVTISVALDNPPTVTITSPLEGAVFDPGDPVTFTGTASDIEDGDLTGAISWTSDRDGSLGTGGSFVSSSLSPGVHVITASVTDSQSTTITDDVTITITLISTPATLNVPFGGSASLPITLSAAAPVGGLDVTIASSDNGVANPVSSNITIPQGTFSANATLDGVAPGSATITVSSAGFGSSVTTVSVVAELDISASSVTFPQGFDETVTITLESQGVPIAAPAGGLLVTLVSADPNCVAAPANVTIPAGLISATATFTYGGSTSTPCSANVTATAPGIQSDLVSVTVNAQPAISVNPGTVGSGLQRSHSAWLGDGGHGGVTVRVTSSQPSVLQISPNSTTAGSDFVDVVLPDGQTFVPFYVQGVEGLTGSPTVQLTAPGFSTGTATIDVVQPGVILSGLSTTTTSLSADDPFFVYIGVPGGNSLSQFQAVRAGASPVTVTVTSSDVAVGEVFDSGVSGATATTTVQPGFANSATSIGAGGVGFDPIDGGSVDVSASIPGFISQPAATASVTVSTPEISVNGATVGAGLQRSVGGTLAASAHGGVTVRVTSSDPAVVEVSPDATTPGTAFVDVVVPDGSTFVSFYAQGVEGQVGSATVTMTAPGFTDGSNTVNVVQPGVVISGLNTSTTTLTPDDPFFVYIGTPSGSSLSQFQALRAGASPLTVTVTSSDVAVGEVYDSGASGATATTTITSGSQNSPLSVGTGGVAFDPIGGGSVDVSASIPGFASPAAATATVSVSTPTMSVASATVGAGLQRNLGATLGASAHGGVTVRVTSSDPAVMRVSPDASTAGTDFIDVVVPNGFTSVPFHVQGIEGQTGSATLTLTTPSFSNESSTITVVQPGVILAGLSTTTTTLSPDDPFFAYVGIPSGSSLSQFQAVRAGAGTLTITATSSNVGTGVLRTSGSSGASVTVDVAEGLVNSPTSLAAGGMAFDPVGVGPVDVSLSAPGFVDPGAGTATVTVSAPSISVGSTTVGAGLQRTLNATLGGSAHGGVTVRVTSSNPSVMQVSPNASTAGTNFIDVVVADGATLVPFYVQGVEGATGTVTVTLSAPGFTDGSNSVSVVQPGVILSSLSTTRAATASNDSFWATIGVPSGGSVIPQTLRAGETTVTATITSSDVGVAQLVTTPTTGGSVTVEILATQVNSPTSVAAGGVEIDPVAIGTTTITVSIPGFITQPSGTVTVTIN